MEHSVVVLVALFAIATSVAVVARRFKIPYTVGLVLAGLVLGRSHVLPAPALTEDLMFAIFLPGLIFEAAFHLNYEDLRSNRRTISFLAAPGVAVAILATAAILIAFVTLFHPGFSLGFKDALVFAALISATDPIAVVGLFRRLGVPRRLAVLVEGESLLNDGTAVLFFVLLLAVATGGGTGPAGVALLFARVVGVGALVGAAIGFGASVAIRRLDEAMIEITLTTIAAYGAFSISELMGGSGVIATVIAGLICGNYGAKGGMSPRTRLAAEAFWEYVAFALNSVVFLLIGFSVNLSLLWESWSAVLAAYVAVTAGRIVVVALARRLVSHTPERLPARWSSVLVWGGLRGGLSMVLALALPPSVAARDLLIAITFGVVLLSIIVQGMTMAPLLRAWNIVRRDRGREYDRQRAVLLSAEAGLQALEEMRKSHDLSAAFAEQLTGEYVERIKGARKALRDILDADAAVRVEAQGRARQSLLLAERDVLLRATRADVIDGSAAGTVLDDLERRLVELSVPEH